MAKHFCGTTDLNGSSWNKKMYLNCKQEVVFTLSILRQMTRYNKVQQNSPKLPWLSFFFSFPSITMMCSIWQSSIEHLAGLYYASNLCKLCNGILLTWLFFFFLYWWIVFWKLKNALQFFECYLHVFFFQFNTTSQPKIWHMHCILTDNPLKIRQIRHYIWIQSVLHNTIKILLVIWHQILITVASFKTKQGHKVANKMRHNWIWVVYWKSI